MTDFLPGDIVEFIDDKTRGTVISIIDTQTLLVDIEDGLEIPVAKNQVVRIRHGSENAESSIRSIYHREFTEKTMERDFPEGIYIALKNDEPAGKIIVYLLNNSDNFHYFTFYRVENENYAGYLKGQLNPDEYCTLTQMKTTEIGKTPVFQLWILPFLSQSAEKPDPFFYKFKTDGEKLLKNKRFLKLLDAEVNLFEVTGKFIPPAPDEKEIQITEKPAKEIIAMEEPEHVVDLHIKEISEHYKTMSSSEIFNFQLDYFKKALEKAIALKYPRIIFIHGIGVNTLKSRIIEHLKKTEHIKGFHDADIRKYGYGAIEVDLN